MEVDQYTKTMTQTTWPAREGLATFLFFIAVTWSVPDISMAQPLLWTGLGLAGAGGLAASAAYLLEHLRENQQPILHGIGTGLVGAGAVAFVVIAFA